MIFKFYSRMIKSIVFYNCVGIDRHWRTVYAKWAAPYHNEDKFVKYTCTNTVEVIKSQKLLNKHYFLIHNRLILVENKFRSMLLCQTDSENEIEQLSS